MGQLSSQDSDTIPPELFNAGAAYYTQFCTKWEHICETLLQMCMSQHILNIIIIFSGDLQLVIYQVWEM